MYNHQRSTLSALNLMLSLLIKDSFCRNTTTNTIDFHEYESDQILKTNKSKMWYWDHHQNDIGDMNDGKVKVKLYDTTNGNMRLKSQFQCQYLIDKSVNHLLFELSISNKRHVKCRSCKFGDESMSTIVQLLPSQTKSDIHTEINCQRSKSTSELLFLSNYRANAYKSITRHEWRTINVNLSTLYQRYCERWILIDTYFDP